MLPEHVTETKKERNPTMTLMKSLLTVEAVHLEA